MLIMTCAALHPEQFICVQAVSAACAAINRLDPLEPCFGQQGGRTEARDMDDELGPTIRAEAASIEN